MEGSDEVQSYDMSQDYFRFVFAGGVEPTPNHDEQKNPPVRDRPHDYLAITQRKPMASLAAWSGMGIRESLVNRE